MCVGIAEKKRRSRRILLLGLGLIALTAISRPADAGPLSSVRPRSMVKVAVPRGGWAYWDHYYLRALGNQSIQVRGPNALRVLRADADGRLPDIPMVWYLQWRRSLRPANFDRYHPQLSQWLKRDRIARLPDSPIGGGPQVPGGVNPPPPIGPEVPEPSSVLIASFLVGAASLWRRRRHAG